MQYIQHRKQFIEKIAPEVDLETLVALDFQDRGILAEDGINAIALAWTSFQLGVDQRRYGETENALAFMREAQAILNSYEVQTTKKFEVEDIFSATKLEDFSNDLLKDFVELSRKERLNEFVLDLELDEADFDELINNAKNDAFADVFSKKGEKTSIEELEKFAEERSETLVDNFIERNYQKDVDIILDDIKDEVIKTVASSELLSSKLEGNIEDFANQFIQKVIVDQRKFTDEVLNEKKEVVITYVADSEQFDNEALRKFGEALNLKAVDERNSKTENLETIKAIYEEIEPNLAKNIGFFDVLNQLGFSKENLYSKSLENAEKFELLTPASELESFSEHLKQFGSEYKDVSDNQVCFVAKMTVKDMIKTEIMNLAGHYMEVESIDLIIPKNTKLGITNIHEDNEGRGFYISPVELKIPVKNAYTHTVWETYNPTIRSEAKSPSLLNQVSVFRASANDLEANLERELNKSAQNKLTI